MLFFKTKNRYISIEKDTSSICFRYNPLVHFTSMLYSNTLKKDNREAFSKLSTIFSDGGVIASYSIDSRKEYLYDNIDEVEASIEENYIFAFLCKDEIEKFFGKSPREEDIENFFHKEFKLRENLQKGKIIKLTIYDEDLTAIEDDSFYMYLDFADLYRNKEFEKMYFFPVETILELDYTKLFEKEFVFLGNFGNIEDFKKSYKDLEYEMCKSTLTTYFKVESFEDIIHLNSDDFSEYIEKIDFFENLKEVYQNIGDSDRTTRNLLRYIYENSYPFNKGNDLRGVNLFKLMEIRG